MKRKLIIITNIIFILCLMCGCGTKVDSDGNYSIDSKWTLVEYTFKGHTTNVKDDPMANLAADKAPAFECSDGKNCTFSLNGKTHSGIVTRVGDGYRITFDDTYKPFLANIDGNKLTLSTENKKVEIVFEAE